MSETATVEVLTAEVRVLMVGSRQVTLSVARQLDYAAIEEIEPFGRVRIARPGDTPQHVREVIGRHRATGALVMCRWADPHYWRRDDGNHVAMSLPLIVLAGLR